MLKYGFPWPEMLRCDQFPSDNALCIGLRAADSHGQNCFCRLVRAKNCRYNLIKLIKKTRNVAGSD